MGAGNGRDEARAEGKLHEGLCREHTSTIVCAGPPPRGRQPPRVLLPILISTGGHCLWDMGTAYVLTLEPTFTQGLIIGQFSILFLLFVILKYLFFDFASGPSANFSYQPRLVINEVDGILDDSVRDKPRRGTNGSESRSGDIALESTDWLNVVLQQVRFSLAFLTTRHKLYRQVLDAYRMKMRGHLPGLDGDELARRRVEAFANKIRPPGLLVGEANRGFLSRS